MAESSTTPFLLVLITWLLIFNMSSFAHKCIESERRALLDIGRDLYDPDDWLSSWRKGGDCCSWQGVICDNITGYVVQLDLDYPFQYDIENIVINPPGPSKLNPSLQNLTHLEILSLRSNNFSGAPIPSFIGSLVNLQYLDLSYTCFNGTIPPQFGNLSNLQSLYIYYGLDLASSTLHVDDLHWLSHLTSLNNLGMSGIDLSRAVDWFDNINMLPNLSNLILDYAGLSTIPTTLPANVRNNLTSLTSIDLFGNSFNSTIPSWLFNNMTSLVELALGVCGLYGELPQIASSTNLRDLSLPHNQFGREVLQHLGGLTKLEKLQLGWNVIDGPFSDMYTVWNNLTHLKQLDLTTNQITGSLSELLGNQSLLENLDLSNNNMTGEIPQSIGNLYNLVEFAISSNRISGSIPDTIGNLRNLARLSLSTNFISGEIPQSLSNLTLLQMLLLSSNNITGQIPKSIGSLNNLKALLLANNGLNGPMFFCNMSSLSYLELSNNNLNGSLPWFQSNSSKLELVFLSNNSLSGHIPDMFGSLPYLQTLHLGGNNLSGGIPLSLQKCPQLYALDLSENKLSGNIPTWIGETLSALVLLSLRSNKFSGCIPTQLSYLTSLQILDLSGNNLTCNLSLSFENFTSMTPEHPLLRKITKVLLLSEYLSLTVKGKLLYYTNMDTNLFDLTIIDLSSNSLSGEIPNGLTKLQGLVFLNLSQNHFTGKIPQNIGSMIQLEFLDLSTNNISGQIPSSMSALTSLSFLNLSHNNLYGPVPTGNQFNSFDDPSIYNGNHGLCGWPLPHCASNTTPNGSSNTNGQKKGEYEDDDSEMAGIFVSAILGFVISYLAFMGLIFIKQSIRSAYFSSIDEIYDRIYVKVAVNINRFKFTAS